MKVDLLRYLLIGKEKEMQITPYTAKQQEEMKIPVERKF
jgi:hypothetical protein